MTLSATASNQSLAAQLPEDLRDGVASPAVVVLLDRVRENVRRILALPGNAPERWRPHLKTTKIPEVWETLIEAGMRTFKCATVREATVFLELADECEDDLDLLVAYPHVGPNLDNLARLATMFGRHQVSVLVESPESAASLPDALGAYVDVNPGMDRTGIPLAQRDRIIATATACGERFRGVHAYEGQLEGTPDERRAYGAPIYAELADLTEALRQAGAPVGEVVTTGTTGLVPALESNLAERIAPAVHRVSPGTVVFHDQRTVDRVTELDLLPAAVILTRVVAQPTDSVVTCDAGSKAIAADCGDPCAVAIDHPELTALHPSEEHLPFQLAAGAAAPMRGTPLLLVPQHICPCVNLAETAYIVDGDSWREVEVAARAH